MIKLLKLLTLVTLLSGCVSVFEHATPIDPISGWHQSLEVVDSLQPTLIWEPEYKGSSDLIVFEGPGAQWSWINEGPLVEKRLLFLESNIEGNTYKIKEPLKPSTLYFWAVREHAPNKKTDWSTYDHYFANILIFGYYKGFPFSFKTPEAQ